MKINREVMGNSMDIVLTEEEIDRIFNDELARRNKNELISMLEDKAYEAIEDIPDSLIDAMIRKFDENDDHEMVWGNVIEYFRKNSDLEIINIVAQSDEISR